MDKISKIASIAIGFALLWVFSACSDDLLMEGQGANGVDRSRMVEVEIPFSLGKGITSHVVTRSTKTTDQQGKDSQLSGIMVFVYENTGTPSKDKRVAWQLFSNPASGNLDNSTGGWIPDSDDPTCGKIKFHVPVGDCYIYLIGNAQGSFLEFFPNLGEEDKLSTLQEFWDKGTPKWSGNMNIVDGYLPMVGMVNNQRGNCHVSEDGKITYIGFDGQKHIIEPDLQDESEYNSFILKRLMSKVTVNIKSGNGVTFTPKEYRFRKVPTYVSPIEAAWTDEQKDMIPLIDTDVVPFSAQSPDSFTVYLPENVRTVTTEINSFAEREAIEKTEDGKNVIEDGEYYKFKNAPQNSTYMEITGRFEKIEGGVTTQSADCRYQIHLGDFGVDKGFQDFSVKRDYHYTYDITVNGVKNILVEVNDGEENPAVEGVVFEGGARVQLDAHYEQVEMKLKKSDIADGVYIYAQTPFGIVNCKYKPATDGEGTFDENHLNIPNSKEQAKKLLQWIELKKQDAKGTLATYGLGTTMDVFAALDKVAKEGTNEGDYYTCFVDEYYYTTNPVNDKMQIGLSDFINAEDRTFSLGSNIQYSKDEKSAVASAVYVLQQHSIACFYDLNNTSVAKFGVENIDEIGDLAKTPLVYNATNEGTDPKNGRSNTSTEVGTDFTVVKWAENGFLLNDNGQLVPSKERLYSSHQSAHLACLTRNRDFNGNGQIDDDELRWYTPARDQMLGLWIGEPALPAKAALYPETTENVKEHNSDGTSKYPIFTSTNGNNRVIWAEEGCSFGDKDCGKHGGYVRAVRNLGKTPSSDSYSTNAGEYYHYDKDTRTIEVFLTDNALRSFSYRELAPHHERSVINRPYRKFQVAAHPYVKETTASCGGHTIESSTTQGYSQLQTTDATSAKNDATTIAAKYDGSDDASVSTTATWRLPNQRELALMVVAMGNSMDYDIDNEDKFHRMNYECINGYWGAVHRWRYTNNYVLHCRTSFSNEQYAQYGYMYNTINDGTGKKIQMLWTTDEGSDLGQGKTGIGGYLCVRDVPAP